MEWSLLDDLATSRRADGQMAADVAMLDAVEAGSPPMLRLYQWRPAALSLGRHQSLDDVDQERCAERKVEITRRPTGGRALLHGADLTYAVAMPIPDGLDGVLERYEHIAQGLAAGLAALGIDATVAQRAGTRGVACFASAEGADLAVGGRKICGSAQVARRTALLQHGAILLDRMPFDETDLLAYTDPEQRSIESERLRTATVTAAELGVVCDARTAADAVIDGFRTALGAEFRVGARAADPGNSGSSGERPTPAGASA